MPDPLSSSLRFDSITMQLSYETLQSEVQTVTTTLTPPYRAYRLQSFPVRPEGSTKRRYTAV
ncbi:uncharacterized protein METZ01_LOCUS380305, partial [marine metagenome]